MPVRSDPPTQAAQLRNIIENDLEELRQRQPVLRNFRGSLTLPQLIMKEYPKSIKDVALLLAAMPVSQVSVERLFSALKLYKSDTRNRLKEDILNAMLVLKANK